MALLTVHDLQVRFAATERAAAVVKDVSFALEAGEILAIVGESGAGKSTIGSAITGLLDYPGRITGGSVKLKGEELVGRPDDEMCKIRGLRIGTIFQNPSTALCPVLSIGTQLVWTIRQHKRMGYKEARSRAIELIRTVGISDPEKRVDQYPHQFSGGMKQRIVIAIALAHAPELIIADEPTTALDVSVQSEILELIKSLSKQSGSGVLLITHNMAVVSEVSDRVAVMKSGEIVEIGHTQDVLRRSKHPYTKALMKAVPRLDEKLERFELLNSASPETPTGAGHVFKAPSSPTQEQGRPILKVEGLGIEYAIAGNLFRGKGEVVKAVDAVSFEIQSGEIFGLVGESGSGKSSVARMIAGLSAPTRGSILFRGIDISDIANNPRVRKSCLDLQMIFQDPFSSLDPRQTILDMLGEPLKVHGKAAARDFRAIALDALTRVGLDASALNKLPHQFSGGQRQRLCIARALMLQPSFLICDEPTSALDVSVQAQVLNLLKDLRDSLGLTMLFISHDLAVVRQMCDHVAVMKRGRVVEQADCSMIFEQPKDPYTINLLNAMPRFGH